ncbi:MAG: DUF839 domain-containing protein [Alphaproteobacteria bacterium]|nr:DUF839 domain-containing protein [Alphaproteobacteria bacterium]
MPAPLLLVLLSCAKTPAPTEPPVPAAPPPPLLAFEPLDLPADPTAATEARVSPQAWVRGEAVTIGWQRLVEAGQVIDGEVFGEPRDITGALLSPESGSGNCNTLDFSALMEVDGTPILVSHTECQPGGVYLARLAQDAGTGAFTVEAARPVDFSGVRGTNLNCAGQITPWGTLLSSEEYETNARTIQPDGVDPADHQGYNLVHNYFTEGIPHVYDYGWIPEVTVKDADLAADVAKHYAMGRFSHELGIVLPDERTVYLSDDGWSVGLYVFVADAPRDLSAGVLYAARFDGESLRWVNLGHATDADIAEVLARREPAFDQLFESTERVDGACPEGFGSVRTTWGPECLRVREGMETLASRLETRRYAALLGATTELNKHEGLAYDPDLNRVYAVISSVDGGMLAADPKWDEGGPDHLGFERNVCGAILSLEIEGPQTDTAGAAIDSALLASRFGVLTEGRPEGEACAVDAIANPDNIAYLPGSGLLMIAEDTGKHPLDTLWAADTTTGALTRVATAPHKAEVTGLQWTPDLGGFGYLTVTFQYGWRSEGPRSTAGVLGPFPTLAP